MLGIYCLDRSSPTPPDPLRGSRGRARQELRAVRDAALFVWSSHLPREVPIPLDSEAH